MYGVSVAFMHMFSELEAALVECQKYIFLNKTYIMLMAGGMPTWMGIVHMCF